MRRAVVIVCLSTLLHGCGDAPTAREPVSAEVDLRMPADLAISEKQLEEPLTDDEVQCFLDLVKSLPGGKPPEFASVPGNPPIEGHSPEAAVEAWRRIVRDALTVDTLMQGWEPRPALRRALNERRIAPRALSSLMLRLSCALAAEGMGGPRMVSAQQVIADEKVDALVARVHQLTRSRQQTPEVLWQSLEEAASLAEYLTLLSTVPAESLQLVAEYRTDLKQLLPTSSGLLAPPETVEDNHIVPISFEKPMPAPRSHRR